MNSSERKRTRERGTQLAEMALVLPLLAFLALVVSEGAGFVRVHQVINNAAREGARLSIEQQNHNPPNGSVVPAIQQAVAQYACDNAVNIPGFGVTCAVSNVTCSAPAIAVNQAVIYNDSAGTPHNATSVTVTCGYTMKYLPKLSGLTPTVALQGQAQFENLL